MRSGYFGLASTRFVGPGQDPFFSSVYALLHMDGTDGSTTFVDEKGHTITPSGAVELDTAIAKFGSASGLFGGGTLLIDAPDLTADFTAECWVNPSSLGVDRHIMGMQQGGNEFRFYIVSDGRLAFTYNGVNGNGGSISTGVFTHAAITRSGTTCRVFGAGTLLATFSAGTAASTSSLRIGQRAGGLTPFAGNIDEVRITVGVARYTSNFTPPADAFPNS